jgi:hypothetical protein
LFRSELPVLNIHAHDNPEFGIKTVFCLRVATGLNPRSYLVRGQNSEAKMLVQGPVPRDVPEGGQRESWDVSGNRPRLCLLDESTADALTLRGGGDTHLLDVSNSIDHVHHDETDGLVGMIDGDPSSALTRVPGQHFDRHRLIVGDVIKPIFPEPLP